jgi:uncharacterized protein (DUF885 family)
VTDTPTRQPTAIDAIAEAHFAAEIALSPITGTHYGIPGSDALLDDFSPDGYAAQSALRRDTLTKLAGAEPQDDIDTVTLDAMRERLGLAEEIAAAGLDRSELNVLAAPLQSIRGVFDLMPTSTDDDWTTFATRLTRVPTALDQWMATLIASAGEGHVAPIRQVRACIDQCAKLVAPEGYFSSLTTTVNGADLTESVRAQMVSAIGEAATAYGNLRGRLATLLDRAPEADACGRERYALHSRDFVGSGVDLEETYAWGQEELARITAQMQEVAEQIKPGATIEEAIAILNADPRLPPRRHRRAARLDAGQGRRGHQPPSPTSTSTSPDRSARSSAMIAPTQTGGIYYTDPVDDFTRPGRMWWSVPKGETTFTPGAS